MLPRTPAAAALKAQFASLRLDLSLIRLALLERKYSPDQPRVPAGSAEGGQWTDGEGGSEPASLDDGVYREGEAAALEHIGFQKAYHVDLRQEEGDGRHGYSKHVGRSEADLAASVEKDRLDTPGFTLFGATPQGSFPDIATANKLVNDTLSRNADVVDDFAAGNRGKRLIINQWTGAQTGVEAYRDLGDPKGVVKIRKTYGLRIVLDRAANVRGFKVRTSYPISREGQSRQ